jgi:hypothetical protein
MQLLHVVRAVVRQGVALEIGPPVLVGVEFRGVPGQVFQVEPSASSQPVAQHSTSVARQTVPHHEDGAFEVPQQVTQELDDLLLPNGSVQVEVKIPAQPMTPWRDRKPADRRDPAVVSGSVSYDRGLSARGPRPAHQGGQQEAGFINEDQMGLPASGQSLDPRPVLLDPRSDSLLVAFDRSAFRLLRGKNPTLPLPAEWRGHGSRRPIAAGSIGGSADRSTGRWRSQTPRHPSAGTSPTPVVVQGSISGAVPAPARDPAPPLHCADTGPTIGKHSAEWPSTSGISGKARSPVDSGQPPSGDVAPIARDFHGVSWFIQSAIPLHKHYFYVAQ